MVVKHCPSCNNTLAVACKTCPACGYVFQAKKLLTAKSSDRKPVVLGERLRPERSKKEVQKGNEYLYHNATVHGGDLKKETEVVLTSTDSLMDYQHQVARKQAKAESVKANVTVKKRGRPKGSKDKQKRLPKGFKQLKLIKNSESPSDTDWLIKARNMLSQNEGSSGEPKVIRKRGRPRGSKNKSVLPPLFYAEDFDDFDSDDKEETNCNLVDAFYIPSEKKEKFSLILEDINQRILGQAFHV